MADRPANKANRPPALRLAGFGPFWRYLPYLVVASIVINLLGLALPLSLLQIYDRILPHQAFNTLTLLMGGVALAVILESLLRMGRNFITSWLASRFEHRINCAAVRRLLDAPLEEYEALGPSVHMERFRSTSVLRDYYSGQALLAYFDLPFAVLFLWVVWLLAGPLVLVPAAMLVVFAVGMMIVGTRTRDNIRKRTLFDERRYGFLAEVMRGIHSVKAMAMEPLMQRRYEMLQDTGAEQSYAATRDVFRAASLGWLFSQATTILVVAFGAVMVMRGELSPGALAACVMLAGRILAPLRSTLATWMRYQSQSVARDRVESLFSISASPNTSQPSLPEVEGAVRLEEMSFRYPRTKTNMFTNLSLDVAPGECVVIQGDSGQGKTTLLAVIAGELNPTNGKVMLDDYDLQEFAPASFTKRIAFLPQHGSLISGTILDNITMHDPSLRRDALDIASKLGIDRVVARMSNGYETLVGGSGGDVLPDGIRQRIAIARALVYDPQVIVFDEANIALDSNGDEALRSYLESLKGERTLIMVTHRPSLVKMADRVLVIEDGHLVPREEARRADADGQELERVGVERPPEQAATMSNFLFRFPVPTDLSVCLVVLLNFLGWEGSTRQLAEALPHVRKRLDMPGFRRIMANLNFGVEESRTSLNRLDMMLMPCLFIPDAGGAKVLIKEVQGGLLALDGITMRPTVLPIDGSSGTVQVYRQQDIAEIRNRPKPEKWVSTTLRRFRPLIWLGLLLTFFIAVLGLVTPGFVMAVYTTAIPSGDATLVAYLAGGVAIAMIIDLLLRLLRGRIVAYIGARSEAVIGGSIFQRLLALPASAVERVSLGRQLARFKDFEVMREALVGPFGMFLYELPATSVYILALAIINPWLLLVIAGAAVLYLVLGLSTRAGLAERVTATARTNSQRQEFLTETLTEMRAIKFAGAEDMWYQRFRQLSSRAQETDLRSRVFADNISGLAQGIGSLIGVAAVTTCVLGVFAGTLSGGAIVASMILTWRLAGPMQNGFMSLATAFRVRRSIRQIDNLMRLPVERDPDLPRRAPVPFQGEVAFSRVSLRYSRESDPALLGLSFRVPPRHVAAIAGPNGAGKSTVLRLIAGIHTPQAGAVRIDNADIRQLDPWDLRAQISYVPQQCDIFYGTVTQNLTLTHPDASEDEVRWATDMAGMTEDILAMPEGFDTRIFDGQGEQLPHGFRQRLSLARAYLKPAPIMLFDEPGNGLDYQSDLAFQKAVGWLRQRSTVIIVSHRPSHLKLADVVLYLDNGYLVKMGSYDDVKDLVLGTLR